MKKTERILIGALVLGICVWFLFPTIKWYAFTSQGDKALISASTLEVKQYSQGQAAKALETLKTKGNEAVPQEYSFTIDLAKKALKEKGAKLSSKTCSAVLSAFEDENSFLYAVESYCRKYIQNLKTTASRALQLGLDLKGGMSILLDVDISTFEEKLGHEASEGEISSAIEQDIEIIKSRIDQFGMAEPEIRKQGSNQILVELAGTPDPERVDSFLKGKGSLAFHLIDNVTTRKVALWAETHEEEMAEIITALSNGEDFQQPSVIPQDRHLAGYYETDDYGIEVLQTYYVIYNEPALDGSYLMSASVEKDRTGTQPVVALKLSNEGGSIFYDFTKNHVGSALSIVMDGHIRSAATIQEALSNNFQISGFSQKEAEDIAIILKTASLPIPVSVASQQTVGASLGEDAVRIGFRAVIIGLILVMVFMVALYAGSGVIADIALLVNLLIIVATMGGFGSTLSLTGIAGIILSLGMAVDANIIIFERIKDEIKEGISPKKAISAGFGHAFWTIFDSNLTTMIAAVVLIVLGSSAVKGFATTLAIGIVSSLFTSLFLSHLLLDLFVKKALSISWKGLVKEALYEA
ncbi:MAG: protein translocase subunit SecD [Sphaerochaetaceae bacterium]|nr:protein translocase subunit SecD [Sphaerochaetaceae bacterium]